MEKTGYKVICGAPTTLAVKGLMMLMMMILLLLSLLLLLLLLLLNYILPVFVYRRQDRQRKRWEDIIREWTGLKFGKSQRAVENREKWRKLVAKSSMVPQRPSRLKD